MLEKLKSRKFLMALLSVILGVLGMLGVADGTIEMVSSIALILIPTIVYIATEGKIDAAAVNQIVTTIDGIADVITTTNGTDTGTEDVAQDE